MSADAHGGGIGRVLGGLFGHGPRTENVDAPSAALKLDDIQGFILRGYRMPLVRHFLLEVGDAAAARAFIGRLVKGDEADAPQITTARDWRVGFAPGPRDDQTEPTRRKPDYCLNLGITWPGLVALGLQDRVPELSFKSFGAFVAGAAERAHLVGAPAPARRIPGKAGSARARITSS